MHFRRKKNAFWSEDQIKINIDACGREYQRDKLCYVFICQATSRYFNHISTYECQNQVIQTELKI